MTHLARSVCHRLMAWGRFCRHFGPISVVPYPSAASTVELIRMAPRNPHMIDRSEM